LIEYSETAANKDKPSHIYDYLEEYSFWI